jgi:alanine racemase
LTATPPRRDEEDAGAAAKNAAPAILTIDLDAIAANYRRLSALAAPAECAAVVKADAYGLGMRKVAPALWRAGCNTFFVATLAEAEALRGLLPEATIYVFGGLFAGTAPRFGEFDVRPVLNSLAEIREWAVFSAGSGRKLPAAIHIDSGMNRLGLSAAEVETTAQDSELWSAFELALVMSHLACADTPEHSKSEAQRRVFDTLRAHLPRALASLANSAGILLGRPFHYDLVRPGIALYGGSARSGRDSEFTPVLRLDARIAQLRDVAAGETVGYGATRTLKRPSRVATIAIGYADGVFRALSAGDGEEGLAVYLGPHPAPILGRVSMDLITVDVTGVPEHLARRGGWVELIGPHVSLQTLAARAGTIDYEILTNLGARAVRHYRGG